jgi:hypothetical protein
MIRIQVITIVLNLIFLFYVALLIVRGKLREEYAIIWCISTIILVTFSFWRDGLLVVSRLFGIYEPPNLVFTVSIFVVFIYLLHLSVVSSKLQEQNKKLAQELALLKSSIEKK